jgi:hypothetical protein
MRAYIDPETGELSVGGPVPAGEVELDADTQNALRHDHEGLEVVRHADGSESMDLQGRYQSVSIIRIDENGKKTICAGDAHQAHRALDTSTPIATTLEVK